MVTSLFKSSKPIRVVSTEDIEQYLSKENVFQIIRYVFMWRSWVFWASLGTRLFSSVVTGQLNNRRLFFALLPTVWVIKFKICFIIFCLVPCSLVERLCLPAQKYFRNFERNSILNKCHDIGIRCFFWRKNCFSNHPQMMGSWTTVAQLFFWTR